MASVAIRVDVFSAKCKLRLFAVVKLAVLPTLYCMAGRAIPFKSTLMAIIQVVTGPTVRGRLLVTLTWMAEPAVHVYVSVFEGEARSGVIKLRVRPGFLAVTLAAIRPEAFLVNVLRPVALRAISGCLSIFFFSRMAVTACGTQMSPVQLEIGMSVIEGLLIETDDILIPTSMV